jgi:hypothetical protein
MISVKQLFALFFLVLVSSPRTQAGQDGRGMEDYVAIGLYMQENFSPEEQQKFDTLVKEIRNEFASRNVNKYVAGFFERAYIEKFDGAFKPEERESFKKVYEYLKEKGAAEVARRVPIRLSSVCTDNRQERTASTVETPGAEICINPKRLALLEWVLSSLDSKIYQTIYEGITAKYSPFEKSHRISFSVLMHEIARQFQRDADHRFFHMMRREAFWHSIASENLEGSNIQFSRILGQMNSIDLLLSPKLGHLMRVRYVPSRAMISKECLEGPRTWTYASAARWHGVFGDGDDQKFTPHFDGISSSTTIDLSGSIKLNGIIFTGDFLEKKCQVGARLEIINSKSQLVKSIALPENVPEMIFIVINKHAE